MAKSNGWVNGFKKRVRELLEVLAYDCGCVVCEELSCLRNNHAAKREVEVELHFTLKIKEDKSSNSNDSDTEANLENGSN